MTNTYNRFLLLLGFVIVGVGQGGELLVSLVVDLSSLNGSDAAVLNVALLRHSGGVSLGSCSADIKWASMSNQGKGIDRAASTRRGADID